LCSSSQKKDEEMMREKGVQFFKFQQTLEQYLCAYSALLIFMLVLGMAPAANAMILQLSVNGDPDPVDSEIFLLPSETLELGIHDIEGYEIGDDVYFVLVTDPSEGTIYGGVIGVLPPPPDTFIMDDAVGNGFWPGPENGVAGGIVYYGTTGTWGPGTYIDGIIFHKEAESDAIVDLWTSPDFVEWTLEDSVTIHDGIPEPTTVLLLGLGGLAVRRRKR
jgi:hypothetical protein